MLWKSSRDPLAGNGFARGTCQGPGSGDAKGNEARSSGRAGLSEFDAVDGLDGSERSWRLQMEEVNHREGLEGTTSSGIGGLPLATVSYTASSWRANMNGPVVRQSGVMTRNPTRQLKPATTWGHVWSGTKHQRPLRCDVVRSV